MQKLLIILVFFLPSTIKSQQFSFEFGKVISKFDYKNSEGERLDSINGSSNNHLAFAVKIPIRRSDFSFYSGIWYNKYGAKACDSRIGNYYSWEVNYVGINVGICYEFFKLTSYQHYHNTNDDEGFTAYAMIYTGSEMLVQGTQTINKEVFRLNGVEQFDKPLILGYGGIGVNYYVSRSFLVFLQYTGGKSFSVFKSSSGDGEKLNLVEHTISLGIGINLPVHK